MQSVFDHICTCCDFSTAQLIFHPESQWRIVLLCDFHRFATWVVRHLFARVVHHLSARVNI